MNQHDLAVEHPSTQEDSFDKVKEKIADIPVDPETAIKHADQQVADLSSEGASMLASVSSETDVAIDAETQAEMEVIKTEAGQAVEALKGALEGISPDSYKTVLLDPDRFSPVLFEQVLNRMIETDPALVYRLPSFDRLNSEQRSALTKRVLEVSPVDVLDRKGALFLLPDQLNSMVERAEHGDVQLGLALLAKGSSVLGEKRAKILELQVQENPERLFYRSYLINLSVEEKNVLAKKLLEIDAEKYLLELSDSEYALNKDQIQIAVDKLVGDRSSIIINNLHKWQLSSEEQEQVVRQVFLEAQNIGSNKLIDLLARYPSIAPQLVQEGVVLPEGRAVDLVKGLSNRFTYSFEDDPSHALNAHTQNQLAASALLEKLGEEELQSVLPDLIEHASDVDFGDRSRVSDLLSRVKDPLLRDALERKSIKPEALEDRIALFQKELAIRSEQNRQKTYDALVVTHGEEKVNEVIAQVEESMFFSVNFPPESLLKILETGKLRSTWETKTRGSLTYAEQRHAVERNLGIRAKGTEKDPHPIYGALGYADGQDEVKGVAPGYGSAFLKLKPESVRERGAFTYGDSFHGETSSRQFSPADAAIARTKIVLDGKENYVELQLLGGATLEDIESINIPLSEVKDGMINGTSIESLREKYPNIIFNTL